MFTPDEVAGVVDLFGALTREQANAALSELAYRRGEEPPEDAIDDALAAFALVGFDHDGDRLVAPGPAAFPELPEGAEDLPHILDIDGGVVDRAAIADAAVDRLRTEAVCAATLDASNRATALVDISYDIETWGGPDLAAIRALLDTVRDGTNY
ncbi:DUF7109 family protein [Natronomonas salsuginis]|uniref:Uncharacterized protein n=1 Tax=Natronomonas salsuginis TaxID=2217661 RepID=A0A4U5JAW7_9EURY|nr:hypothetical protein [Natronomonas salsuginis]TKR25725.1 hypothetical protein DM868_09980 [Natronomonas salsuginis]